MTKYARLAAAATLVLLPLVASAQTGCVHSPECPTAFLGLVGAGGATLYARWRAR